MSACLSSLGWDEQYAAEFTPYESAHTAARVTRVDRGAADVLGDAGYLRVELTWQHSDITVGDWVAITDDDELAAVLPRRTAIVRAAPSGESSAQTLVANIDQILVVVPAVPRPRLGMVERLVALAWDSGATPVVVVTKVDLAPSPESVASEIAQAAPGCQVIIASAHTGEGMDEINRLDRPGRSICLLGRSGAGKSTLANAIVGSDRMAVAEVRRDGKGRHTTTHRELITLPGGGVLIDTPGLRGVGVWIAEDGVAQTFPEIEALVEDCRFNDCQHESEPGCAVQAAIAEGTLPQRRLDSWRKIAREAEWIASRSDARLRRERADRWRQIHLEARRNNRTRPQQR
ncbi:MAG: ribosome small subunit-dependent GTPase A [Frankiaceae bacterium]|nr:ribosome small subunit-dependent GTPase A [Frankiaceae bacterium]